MSVTSTSESPRMLALQAWLGQISTPALRLDSLRVASADASFRRYFRIDDLQGKSYIVMDAPPPAPPLEDVATFIHRARVLDATSVSVPQILAQELEQGFLLLSDFGQVSYSQVLNHDTAHKLYMDAIDSLILIQTQSQPDVLPEYDRAFLLRELQIFPDWYVKQHLGVTLSDKQQATLQTAFDTILGNVMAQPQVYVHRDFHSRNLMVLDQGNPGIIDFQGALYGPITYDLASLLRDAYVQWDEEMVLDWAVRYWEKAKRAGLPVSPEIDSFYRDFEFMGLQRHLKILGIFARLHYRDGKSQYLSDIPLVMEYVRKTAHRYIELRPLLRLLDEIEQVQPQTGYTF
jgi:aminoglycoside/choline kinase family phosphotransferase